MDQQFTLYLIGYGNQVPEEFFNRLEAGLPAQNGNGCRVIDVRQRRRSWAWSYSGPQIEYIIKGRGHDYIWLPQLGNAGHAHQVKLVNEYVGLMALERQVRTSKHPIVLLCAELRSGECHRSVVAQKLADRLAAAGDTLEVRPL